MNFSCKEVPIQSDLDSFISQMDNIYKSLVQDAIVESIDSVEYTNVNLKEVDFSAGGNVNMKQKVVNGKLGVNIFYQKIEAQKKTQFRKITGKTDSLLQKKMSDIALIGLKCYDYNKKQMDEKCKKDGIDQIIKNYPQSTIEKDVLRPKQRPDTIALPFSIKKVHK